MRILTFIHLSNFLFSLAYSLNKIIVTTRLFFQFYSLKITEMQSKFFFLIYCITYTIQNILKMLTNIVLMQNVNIYIYIIHISLVSLKPINIFFSLYF